jgi:hypothetical protein
MQECGENLASERRCCGSVLKRKLGTQCFFRKSSSAALKAAGLRIGPS